ncbi:MAG: hypothetical protein HY830_12530, partial [Actinobacteria bacterium]|nr:hypothetical protein [Actinomycetota bacterium]
MIAPGVVLTRETRTPPWRGARSVVLDGAAFAVATVLLAGAAVFAPRWYLAALCVALLAEAALVLRPDLLSWAAELSQAGPFWRGSLRGATACLLVGVATDGGRALHSPAGIAFMWVTVSWLVLQL